MNVEREGDLDRTREAGVTQDSPTGLRRLAGEGPEVPPNVRTHRLAALLARGAVRAAAATPESMTPGANGATKSKK